MFEEARSLPEDAPRRAELEQEMAVLYGAAIQAHEARIAAKNSSREIEVTNGSSPVKGGTGASILPLGPADQALPSSEASGSPSSSKKNLADGLNSSGSNSGSLFTPELTLGSPGIQDVALISKIEPAVKFFARRFNLCPDSGSQCRLAGQQQGHDHPKNLTRFMLLYHAYLTCHVVTYVETLPFRML